jgi:hypothetical protein
MRQYRAKQMAEQQIADLADNQTFALTGLVTLLG